MVTDDCVSAERVRLFSTWVIAFSWTHKYAFNPMPGLYAKLARTVDSVKAG